MVRFTHRSNIDKMQFQLGLIATQNKPTKPKER